LPFPNRPSVREIGGGAAFDADRGAGVGAGLTPGGQPGRDQGPAGVGQVGRVCATFGHSGGLRVLMRYQSIVAHFSGQGHPRDGIQVVDETGRPRSVPPHALSGLFGILSKGLRCVVLNACHTDEQAAAIAAHVPCVVGMRRQVLDDTAILFATGFYRGLADGKSIRTSFELGRV
jgi:hypothetical protein